MSEHYKQASFKKLLEKLQEESWQLELIISGFAIYGLFVAYEPISIAVKESQHNQEIYKFVISMVAMVSCAILIFNLLLHVILRGLWIGALGLRYVSGDIDYDSLKYSKKFTNYLKRRVGSFDKYIATLENYCSIIFAISFLLIFYVLAFTLTIVIISIIGNYIIDSDVLPTWLSKYVGVFLIIFIIIGMLLTVFDFITQGWLKKKQWISKIYFPVYWVFSFITLSFLYRPLVYNFLDNKFGKRLSFMLLPIYVVILLITSLEQVRSNYLDESISSRSYYANNKNYEDLISEEDDFIENVAIPSKVIKEPFLKVFVVFSENIEDQVTNFNPDLEPEVDNRGLKSDIRFSNNNVLPSSVRDSLSRIYLKTFNEMYMLKIDTLDYDSEFILAQSKRSELGFETYLDIKGLPTGRHDLKVTRNRIEKGDTVVWRVATIPFWYFED